MPKLVLNPGTPQAREFPLRPGKNFIGRGFANDIKIEDTSVSSSHAQITLNGTSVIVKDLGSTNGTFINKSPITENVLLPGTTLRLGGVDLLFSSDAAATVVPATANPTAPNPIAAMGASSSTTTGSTLILNRPPVPQHGAPAADPSSGPTVVITRASVQAAATPPVAQEPEQPAQRPVPEPPGGFATPPPGKTACKFHPKTAGQWMCRKCNELFCAICVSSRPAAGGTQHFCRKCGDTCVQVKVTLAQSKEKQMVVHSDSTVLYRSIGFGAVAMVVSILLWAGIAWVLKFDVPFVFCAAIGALCGYAIKLASQDRPGVIFSAIAVFYYLVAVVLGKLGMILVTHNAEILASATYLLVSVMGVVVGGFLAWWLGGGDF